MVAQVLWEKLHIDHLLLMAQVLVRINSTLEQNEKILVMRRKILC